MKKYIGNVIVNKLNYKVDDCFNKCKSMSEVTNNLPTLIIGLNNAKENISDFNILKREYCNGMLWWTFSKTEKRIDYDKDILDFKKFCIKNIVGEIDYKYVNYVDLKYSDAKKYIKYILGNRKKCYYVDNDKFIFLYDKENTDKGKHIYGFSLNTLAFFGISRKKIIDLFEKNNKNVKIRNFFSLPRNIRTLINDDIPSKMVLFEYF